MTESVACYNCVRRKVSQNGNLSVNKQLQGLERRLRLGDRAKKVGAASSEGEGSRDKVIDGSKGVSGIRPVLEP
jgi:hypothetical protein